MPSGRFEIPALPILIPLGVTLMVVALVVLRRRRALTPGRLGAAWLSGWYAVAVLGATMLPLLIAWGPRAGDPETFRILLVPIVTMRPDDFVLNVAMTVPLAAVLRLIAGVRERDRVVLIGFLLSLSIEMIQLLLLIFAHSNRWADSNDLIANTLGAWLGWLVLRRLLRRPAVANAFDRWTLAPQPEPSPRS